ncbi:hypothetical protein QUF72_04585 [Desulfobacterales bacterium HSG2]|nr:hypothetical protein [Desulfobacterales bacterium HSG2]
MQDKIVDLIVAEATELNEEIKNPIPVAAGVNAPLFGGDDGVLTSIGLVTLIVAVEQAVEDAFETPVILANEKAMSMKNSPFRTIGSLADYIIALLKDNGNG